jgi:LuxR family transcriptional regulator, maltose regulon positive regulatory protein
VSSSSTLLATKLLLPVRRPNLVLRPQLIDRLDRGLHAGHTKVTVICASAGYGKTTLVTEWLHNAQYPVAWLSLDEQDNDPARFLAYLIAALRQIDAGLGANTEALLQSPQPPPPEMVLTSLINDLAAIASPFILALDDYHVIHTAAIHQQHAFLLEHQPSHMHQVIVTREDPPLPISRLRARGQVEELRQDDLRFTLAEAAEFLHRVMGLDLAADDVAALESRTEGWAAGLQLAALSLQERGALRGDVRSFVQAFAGSNRYVLDYLFDEVLLQQSTDIQEFLLQTSILDRLCAPLCEAVTGRGDSQQLLQTLDQANLFIVPLDQARTWYRYHHLFSDLLRHRLRTTQAQSHQKTGIVPAEALLHRRASQWHEAVGNLPDAIQHALAASDWERAATLISQVSRNMVGRGEIVTLLQWCRALPDEALRAQPVLCLDYSWSLILAGQHDAAESYLRYIEQAVQDDVVLLGETLSAQAQIARTKGDYARTIELAQRALSLLPQTEPQPRSLAALTLGLAYSDCGNMPEAEQAFMEADRAAQQAGGDSVRLMALAFLSSIQAARGHLHRAAEMARQALQLGRGLPALASVHSMLGALLYEWNDLDAAVEHVQQAIELGRQGGHLEVILTAYHGLAWMKQAEGDASAANAALQTADDLAREANAPPIARASNAAVHVTLALAQGDVAAAAHWVDQITTDSADASGLLRGFARARLLLAQNDKAAAAELLEKLHAEVVQMGRQSAVIEARKLQALAAPTITDGLAFLTEALTLTQVEGYVRTFIDEGEPMAVLLRQAATKGIAPDYVARLLSAFEPTMKERPVSPAPPIGAPTSLGAATSLVEPLSERELEVLRLMAAGLSNHEIADKLIISTGTVKSHVHSILGKLDARDRTQAVLKAQELKLV